MDCSNTGATDIVFLIASVVNILDQIAREASVNFFGDDLHSSFGGRLRRKRRKRRKAEQFKKNSS